MPLTGARLISSDRLQGGDDVMLEIIAYQCSDGSLHTDEDKARAHEDDLLGQELDGLLRLFALDITRVQEHRGLLRVMQNRKDLRVSLLAILKSLDHGLE